MLPNQLISRFSPPLGNPSRLRLRVLRMISTNALAAFTQDVSRTRPGAELQAPQAARRTDGPPGPEQVAQRRLDAVPAPPSKPLPRGSLLDLRV